MNYESKSFDNHKNLRAKLRNSVADLRWYAWKLCEHYKFIRATKDNALEIIAEIWQTEKWLPDELERIHFWKSRIATATPETANQLFYDCWRFIHSFDEKLNNHV